jgi:uncharacterized protein (TIGR03083 family)
MDDDRQTDVETSVPRDLDALLQIADRRESTVPAGLASVAFDRAFAARRAGSWYGFGPDDDIDGGESYGRAVHQFETIANGLSEREWRAAVPTYGTVHDLVAHLAAIEAYTGQQIGLFADDIVGAPHDHIRLSDAWIERLRSTDHATVLDEWRRRAHAIRDAVVAQPQLLDAPGSWHGAPIDVASLLVIRTFELWTHGDDVLMAAERPRYEPDNGQLKLMTNLAAEILPLGLALIGRPHRGTVRLVLTGRGGGTWRRPLEPGAALGVTDDLLVVADAVGFCRLAANRCRPDELDAYIEGDDVVAADILAGMGALAAD